MVVAQTYYPQTGAQQGGTVILCEASSHSLKLLLMLRDTPQAVFIASELKRVTATLQSTVYGTETEDERSYNQPIPHATHAEVIKDVLMILEDSHPTIFDGIVAAGYVFPHGGDILRSPVMPINDSVLKKLERVDHLAPHHTWSVLSCYHSLRHELPSVEHHAAIIGTAFYTTIPSKARWADATLPSDYRDGDLGSLMYPSDDLVTVQSVYEQVEDRLYEIRRDPCHFNCVICYVDSVGGIRSVTAISDGRAVDTAKVNLKSLLWPGSLDPGLIPTAALMFDKKMEQVWQDLVQQQIQVTSGHDRKGWWKRGDKFVFNSYIYQLAKTIVGCMLGLSGPLDALVFCSYTEEVSSTSFAELRRRCLEQMQSLVPFQLDDERNRRSGADSDGILTVEGAWPVVLRLSVSTGLTPEAAVQSRMVMSCMPPPKPVVVPQQKVVQQKVAASSSEDNVNLDNLGPSIVDEACQSPEGPLIDKVSDYFLSALGLD